MTRFLAGCIIIVLFSLAFGTLALAETGLASWYGSESGSHRADGHRFRPHAVSCAHRTLPLRTWIKVTDLKTRRSIRCQVLDRGPYRRGRIVDLSKGAARQLGIVGRGVARVRLQIVR